MPQTISLNKKTPDRVTSAGRNTEAIDMTTIPTSPIYCNGHAVKWIARRCDVPLRLAEAVAELAKIGGIE